MWLKFVFIGSVDICLSCVGSRHPLTIILLGEMQNHSTRTCETFQWDGVAERLIQTNGFSDETYILNLHIYAIGLTRMLSDVSLQFGLKYLEKITSFFGLLHLWNMFGRDKANENNEKVQEQIRQIFRTNPAYRTTLWQHWGRRSKSPSHNFCSGGRSWDLSFQTFKQNMENLSPF